MAIKAHAMHVSRTPIIEKTSFRIVCSLSQLSGEDTEILAFWASYRAMTGPKTSWKQAKIAVSTKKPEKPCDFPMFWLTRLVRLITFALRFERISPVFLEETDTMAKSAKKSITKAEIYETVAKETGHTKAEVKKFFAALEGLVIKQLGKKGPGVIALPGLVKLTAVKKPATKGGEKRPNPFKPGEFIITKPKPARTKLKARGLKTFLEGLYPAK
jgi:nucleoid DNA-binding protein